MAIGPASAAWTCIPPTVDLPVEQTAALAERYAIERALGRGGTATVYPARDLEHERLVALEVTNPQPGAVLGNVGVACPDRRPRPRRVTAQW